MELANNPYFVLELGPDATAMEIERKTQRLLSEIELGRASAMTFRSPFGVFPRDAEAVRSASRILRDPALRSEHAQFVPPIDLWPVIDGLPPDDDTTFPELLDTIEKSMVRDV